MGARRHTYSPGLPLWCERLIPGPSGFPPRACTTTSRRGFAALRYGHHPGPPTRPAFTPRGSPVSRLLPRQYARMTRQPCCGDRTPHPTRSQARIGGPGADGITRGHLASHRDRVGPMYRPELCAWPGVSARRPPPPVPLPPVSLGRLGAHAPAGAGFPATDTPCSFTGLSAGPVGTGLGFPPDRRRDRDIPPAFGAGSLTASVR
jgi:hypothetical protein